MILPQVGGSVSAVRQVNSWFAGGGGGEEAGKRTCFVTLRWAEHVTCGNGRRAGGWLLDQAIITPGTPKYSL